MQLDIHCCALNKTKILSCVFMTFYLDLNILLSIKSTLLLAELPTYQNIAESCRPAPGDLLIFEYSTATAEHNKLHAHNTSFVEDEQTTLQCCSLNNTLPYYS